MTAIGDPAVFAAYRHVPTDGPLFTEADRELLVRFTAYHEQNPEVFGLFIHYALELWEAGRRRGSAWAVVQRIRWDHWLRSDAAFMLNNDFIALYARLAIHYFPYFREFFELRHMKHNRHVSHEEVRRTAPS